MQIESEIKSVTNSKLQHPLVIEWSPLIGFGHGVVKERGEGPQTALI